MKVTTLISILVLLAASPGALNADPEPQAVKPTGVTALPAGTVEFAFSDVATALGDKGYKVKLNPSDTKLVKVEFTKVATTGHHGLLKVPWTQQISGEAQYVLGGESWQYASLKVAAMEKPPVVGNWKTIEVHPDTETEIRTIFSALATIEKPAPIKKSN